MSVGVKARQRASFTFLLNLSFGFGAPEASPVCMHMPHTVVLVIWHSKLSDNFQKIGSIAMCACEEQDLSSS